MCTNKKKSGCLTSQLGDLGQDISLSVNLTDLFLRIINSYSKYLLSTYHILYGDTFSQY